MIRLICFLLLLISPAGFAQSTRPTIDDALNSIRTAFDAAAGDASAARQELAAANARVDALAAEVDRLRPRMGVGANLFNKKWGRETRDFWPAGINWATVENPWRADFLADMSIYSSIRFMDLDRTNASDIRTWSQRVQMREDQYAPQRMAYEWMIDLCNRLNVDAWICMPHLTIEDYEANPASNYWVQCAKLFRERLKPNLKVYVEYSNEVWNWGFGQSKYASERGVKMGMGNPDESRFTFNVYAFARMAEVWEREFAGQRGRLVTVLGGQLVDQWRLERLVVTSLKSERINPKRIKPDAYAIATYVGNLSNMNGAAPDVRDLWMAELDKVVGHLKKTREVIRKGFENPETPIIAYEGGSHVTTNARAMRENPAMYEMYTAWLERTAPYVPLTLVYCHNGGWDWGAKERTEQPVEAAHGYRAMRDYLDAGK